MHVKQLEHLVALAETGSFSRAAERAFITQSALSRSIQSLEEELGGRLFDRIGKRNELTPLGRDALSRARTIVRDAVELRRSAELLQQGGSGEMRVALGSGPGALLMTPLLCYMAKHHPRIRVAVTRGPVELQLIQLRARQLDALVVDVRRVVPSPDLTIEPLSDLRAGFVCRADHPLARQRAVKLGEMLVYPIASTPLSDEVARLMVQQYGPQANPATMITLQCEEVASLIDTVAQTQAIFLGVLAAARAGLASGRLAELAVRPRLSATAKFAYVTLVGRTEAPAMALFRRFVGQHLRD